MSEEEKKAVKTIFIHDLIRKDKKLQLLAKEVANINNKILSFEHTLMNMLNLSGLQVNLEDIRFALKTWKKST